MDNAEKLDIIEHSLAEVTKRQAAMEIRLLEKDSKITKLSEHMAEIDMRLDRGDRKFDLQAHEITSMKTDISSLKSDMSDVKKDVSAVKDDMTILKKTNAAMASDLHDLKNQFWWKIGIGAVAVAIIVGYVIYAIRQGEANASLLKESITILSVLPKFT